MKNLKLAAALFAATMLTASNAYAGNWVQTSTTWEYHEAGRKTANTWVKAADGHSWFWINSAGKMAVNEWFQYNGQWYFTKADGIMANNEWVQSPYSGQWYFMNNGGAMAQNQWLEYKGQWYYLGSDGAMVTNKTVDGYYLNASGVWSDNAKPVNTVVSGGASGGGGGGGGSFSGGSSGGSSSGSSGGASSGSNSSSSGSGSSSSAGNTNSKWNPFDGTFHLKFSDNLEEANKKDEWSNAKLRSLLSKWDTSNMSELEKAIVALVVTQNAIDYKINDDLIRSYPWVYTDFVYKTLKEGSGQCHHYVILYQRTCELLGLKAVYMSEQAYLHAVAGVEIDGEWYMVDPTNAILRATGSDGARGALDVVANTLINPSVVDYIRQYKTDPSQSYQAQTFAKPSISEFTKPKSITPEMLRNALSKVLTGKTLDEIAADEAEAKRKDLEEIEKKKEAKRLAYEAEAPAFIEEMRAEGWTVVATSSEGVKNDLEAQERSRNERNRIKNENAEAYSNHKLEINTKKFGYVYVIYYKITG
jgi:surface protein C